MSRLEWILGGILAVLLVGVAVMVTFVWLRPAPQTMRPVATRIGLTARNAYLVGEPVARAWAADARLIAAQATWQESSSFPVDEASWSLVFYSAGQSTKALVTVVNGAASLISTSEAPPGLEAQALEPWQFDSPDAITRLLLAGGQTFLSQHGKARLVLRLDAHEQLTWKAMLVETKTNWSYSVEIDAREGHIIAVQPAP
jgi:hypothetical protein